MGRDVRRGAEEGIREVGEGTGVGEILCSDTHLPLALHVDSEPLFFEPSSESLFFISKNLGHRKGRQDVRERLDGSLRSVDLLQSEQEEVEGSMHCTVLTRVKLLAQADSCSIFGLDYAKQGLMPQDGQTVAETKANRARFDPYKNFKFRVIWEGRCVAGVNNVSGLQGRNSLPSTRKSRHRGKYESLTLENGVTCDTEFQQWAGTGIGCTSHKPVGVSLRDVRKDITIELHNEAGQLVAEYKVYRCWVSEYQAIPDLDAGADTVAIQMLRLENEGWELSELASSATAESQSFCHGLLSTLEPLTTWKNVDLPEKQRRILHEIAMHVKPADTHGRRKVAGGLPHGGSTVVLFHGLNHTGKTLAAQILAGELGLDLYRVDLSQVVSKYIDETEKSLQRVFDTAENSGAILLFDEADALCGKRTEVKESHDRYANIEVSYLLQKLESYCGLTILTTNTKESIDTAFLRRMAFVIDFPIPDAAK